MWLGGCSVKAINNNGLKTSLLLKARDSSSNLGRSGQIRFEPYFKKLLVGIVQDLNNCGEELKQSGEIMPHIAKLGVDPYMFTLRISSSTVVHPLRLEGVYEKSGSVCGMHSCLFDPAG